MSCSWSAPRTPSRGCARCWPATSPPTAPVTSAETASPAITALSVDERSLRTIHAQSRRYVTNS